MVLSMKWHRSFFLSLWGFLGKQIMYILGRSCNIQKIVGKEHIDRVIRTGQPTIFCFWHNNIFFLSYYLYQFVFKKGIHLTVLISQSKDAEWISRIVEKWGGSSGRGSSTRGGADALRVLAKALQKKHHSIVVTPDGPRGPKYKIQSGMISLAQLTKTPIIPLNFNANRKWVFNSWDNFILPKFFSKIVISIGKPYHIPRSITDLQKKEMILDLEKIMLKQVEENTLF